MFEGMGVQWAATFLGILAILLIIMPILFLLKGPAIRAKSKFAPGLDLKYAQKKKDLEAAAGGGVNDNNNKNVSETAKEEATDEVKGDESGGSASSPDAAKAQSMASKGPEKTE